MHVLQALGIWKPSLLWHVLENRYAKGKAGQGSAEPYAWSRFPWLRAEGSAYGRTDWPLAEAFPKPQQRFPVSLGEGFAKRLFPTSQRQRSLRAGQQQGCSFPEKQLRFNLKILLIYRYDCRGCFILLSKQQEPFVPQEDFILEQPGQMQRFWLLPKAARGEATPVKSTDLNW